MIIFFGFKVYFFRLDSFLLFFGKFVIEFFSFLRFWFLFIFSRLVIRLLGIIIV